MSINHFAVFVAALIQFALGALWYSPALFVKPWMRSLGITDKMVAAERKKGNMAKQMARSMSIMFLGAWILSYALAFLFAIIGVGTFLGGAIIGVIAWLGFIVTTNTTPVLFEKRPIGAYIIFIGFELVALILAGGLLGVWR